MMKISKIMAVSALLASATLSGQAVAEKGDLSASLKFGKAQTSSFTASDGSKIDPDGDNAFGFTAGYEIYPNITAEFQFIKSEASDSSPGFNTVNIDETSLGLFGVYRTERMSGSPYLLGKVGFTKSDTEIRGGGITLKSDESGLSYGAGVGYQFSDNMAFELEYYVDSDVFSYILLSARIDILR